jgi:predicted nucleotidyltransferase
MGTNDNMFNYEEAERVIQMAKEKIDASLIIVFGSVASGTATEDSDLDIIVVKETDENSFISGAKARLALKGSKVPIDIIVYTPEEFGKDLSDKYSLVHEAMATGRIVHGSV